MSDIELSKFVTGMTVWVILDDDIHEMIVQGSVRTSKWTTFVLLKDTPRSRNIKEVDSDHVFLSQREAAKQLIGDRKTDLEHIEMEYEDARWSLYAARRDWKIAKLSIREIRKQIAKLKKLVKQPKKKQAKRTTKKARI